MARPREFDRDAALEQAMLLFWRRGYAATSTEELVAAMGIGRQSLYGAFGDKETLYLEALQRYHANAALAEAPCKGGPLERIEAMLRAAIERDPERRAMGCMGINATAAFGQSDARITRMSAMTARRREADFAGAVGEAKAQGLLGADVDEIAAAQFLYVSLQGLTVRSQAGMPQRALQQTIDFTMQALKAL